MHRIFCTDIDEVLLDMNSIWLTHLREQYGIIADFDSMRSWNLPDNFGNINLDELWAQTWRTPLIAFEDSLDFLSMLSMADIKVIAITHREPGDAQDACKRDMRQFRGLVDEVIFTKDKVEVMRDLGLENILGFVDDKWATCMKTGTVVKTFLLNKPWNQCLDINVPYKRAYSLSNIVDKGWLD